MQNSKKKTYNKLNNGHLNFELWVYWWQDWWSESLNIFKLYGVDNQSLKVM
jgi:hypothetical protein